MQYDPDLRSPAAAAVDDLLAPFDDTLLQLRRHLHAHPEISWQEQATTAHLETVLREAGLSPRRTTHGGLMVDFGQGPSRIGLRADIDALPVEENTGLRFASTNPGVMHACGHDIHTTALVGACLALGAMAQSGTLPGPVRAFFQPAEETQPSGARAMMEDGILDGVRRVFAVHCDPKVDVGRVGSKVGPITSASESLHVTVTSRGGHTSRPHLTGDVVYALGQIITQTTAVLDRRLDARKGVNLTWGMVHAGQAANAIPSRGTVSGTLRCLDMTTWREAAAMAVDVIHEIARPYGVAVQVERPHGLPPVTNDADTLAVAEAAAADLLGADGIEPTEQSMGGEDFGWYLTEVPGALLRLGTRTPGGPTYDLHQSDVVFDERAIGIGARLFTLIALHASRNTLHTSRNTPGPSSRS